MNPIRACGNHATQTLIDFALMLLPVLGLTRQSYQHRKQNLPTKKAQGFIQAWG